MPNVLDHKDPEEIIVVTFPFAGELGAATINAGPTVTVTVLEGTDPSPAGIKNGPAQISGSDVFQSINALTLVGVKYHLQCLATLSDGRRLVRTCILPIQDL
jgi:hypothetical protein